MLGDVLLTTESDRKLQIVKLFAFILFPARKKFKADHMMRSDEIFNYSR